MQQGRIQPRGFHCLIYGPPGVLKTTLAAQGPKPLLFLDWEGGTGWLDQSGVDLRGVEVMHAAENESATRATSDLLLQVARAGRYRCVVIDSLTNVRARELDRLANGLMPEQGHYGLFQAWLARTLWSTQFFDQVVIWTAGYEEQMDGNARVLVPGGFSANNLITINQTLDAIIYAGWKQQPNKPAVRFVTSDPVDPLGGRSKIMTKDRTGLLPGLVELPERAAGQPMPDMAELVFGQIYRRLAAGQPVAGKDGATAQRPSSRTATAQR